MAKGKKDWMRRGMWELSVIGIMAMVIGCTRHVYVPVESHSTDTLINIRERVDSILERDSVYVEVRGDTLIREVWRWRTKNKLRTDTLYRTRVDTVAVVVPATISAEKKRESVIAKTITWVTRCAFLLFAIALMLRWWFSKKK